MINLSQKNVLKPLRLIFLSFLFVFVSCGESKTPPPFIKLSEASLIPAPVEVNQGNGYFEVNEEVSIVSSDESLAFVSDYLAKAINSRTGLSPKESSEESKNTISLQLKDDAAFASAEAYTIEISSENIEISSPSEAGVFFGIQTLIQLLDGTKDNERWAVGAGEINDKPRFDYRGSMLDVSRHFFTVDQVKHYIDLLTPYKFNHLHLHLSDDQGWRIEIKSWPELTKVGGSTEVGGGEGGFYTQEDYKEIVAYAAERYITVVPEIDMPGHTNAALASYTELNCDDKATELYTGIEVGFSSFCVDKPVTYKFIDDVVREISAITPGKYFHAGGDESHATEEKDYIKFVDSVQKIVSKYNKTMIGWDEVQLASIDSNTVAQFWASEENAKGATAKGNKLLFSPASKMYMDMKYDSITKLGLKWAGYIELDDAYNWDPSNYVQDITDDQIIGIEAPLWTETIETTKDIEYMVFPRLLAYAEIGWSQAEKKDWEGFKSRLKFQLKKLDKLDVLYYNSPKL